VRGRSGPLFGKRQLSKERREWQSRLLTSAINLPGLANIVASSASKRRHALVRRLVWRADELRDARRYADAAAAYQAVLSAAPHRTDLRVQLGNMLKDSGRLAEAESVYRAALTEKADDADIHLQLGHCLKLQGRTAAAVEAYGEAAKLTEQATIRLQYANMLRASGNLPEAELAYRSALAVRPDDSNIHLQLGHCLKLQGRRQAALEAYGQAAELTPFSIEPKRELFLMGQRQNQESLFEAQLRLGGAETLMEVAHQVTNLRAMLSRLVDVLPDIQAQMAFPIGSYDRFREIYDVPPPPRIRVPRSFAILLLADREALETLRAQITAVRLQTHEQWRLSVIGVDPARRRAVEHAAAGDARIAWSESSPDENAAQAEQRIALSTQADWILLLAERALLHPKAIEWFTSVAEIGTATAFVTDEETGTRERGSVRRSSPELRQVIDYDTLLEMNPFGETIAVEHETYMAAASKLATSSVSTARSSLLLTLSREGRVGHIPCPLVCRDGLAPVDPLQAGNAHEEAVRAHVAEEGLAGRIVIGHQSGPLPRLPIRWRSQASEEPIAVIIPTRDNGADVKRFVESLRAKAAMPNALRIVIIDNGSRQTETRAILESLAATRCVTLIPLDEPFNWSWLNNRAVETVSSSLLVFANDDMIMISERWDECLRGLLERPEIGAVGARLLYEGDTLQHAGILFGWRGSEIHDGLYESSFDPGPANRWHVTRAVSAVTGAFLATRREAFLAHQGFDEIGLPVACSDTDYALKLRTSGLKILWTPDITLYHHESKTRGLDHLDPEKRARSASERAVFETRWGAALDADPSLNPLWHKATLPFRLVSAPSQSRLWAHIARCAAANPWLPVTDAHRNYRVPGQHRQ
jgi:GT2 family glycosyltransferase/tetratricopeptide (TPR) repeat protein